MYTHHNLCTSVFLNRGLDYASPLFTCYYFKNSNEHPYTQNFIL